MMNLQTFNIKAANLSDKKSQDLYNKMSGADNNDGKSKKKGKQGKAVAKPEPASEENKSKLSSAEAAKQSAQLH